MERLMRGLERVVIGCGTVTSLFIPLTVMVIILNVIMRYVFSRGMIELEELQWHLNAVAVMGAIGWAYLADGHVRVDAIAGRWTARRRAVVELLGIVFLLAPFLWFLGLHSWGIFEYSWRLREGSPMPSGLPARYVIKGVMFLGVVLLALAGIAKALRLVLFLSGRSLNPEKTEGA